MTRSKLPSRNGSAAASVATACRSEPARRSMPTAGSAATTRRAPAASAARPATPVPAPRSSTCRPASGTGAEATSARASGAYICSGPPAQPAAAAS